ncbi:unnamed protein product, partial [Phaeothamnion confervicola]
PSRQPYLRLLAPNLDRLVIVSALQEPAFRPGLVDRLLIMAEQENLQAVIVLNKLDLDRQQGERYRLLYSGLGYPTFLTSTVTGLGVPELRSQLAGRSALCGHSGVGKSSLLRALAPELTPQTGEVSLANNKGQHTTTSVRLYSTEWGEIFDLPGLKLAPLTMEPTPTGAIFPNLAPVGVGFVTACTVRKAGAGSWLLWRAASWIRSGMI